MLWKIVLYDHYKISSRACVSLGTSIYPLLRYHCKITYVTTEKSIEGHDADPFQVYYNVLKAFLVRPLQD